LALADVAEDVLCGHAALVEDDLARCRRDPELVFLLADGQPGRRAFDEERGDAAIPGRRIDRCKDDENAGFDRVADPQFAT
jgi:hypothetical protein